MSELRKLPSGWRWAKLGEVCDVVKGVTPRREWYTAEGVRIVKFRDIKAGKLNWEPGVNSYVPDSRIPRLRKLRTGMTLVGADAHNPEYIGKKVCFVRIIPENPAFFSGELMSFQSKDAECIADEWSFLWLSSAAGYEAVQNKVSGMHLNANPAKEIPIPLPPLPKQNHIIKLFNRQMAEVEKMRLAAEEKVAAVCLLPSALLREVFPYNKNDKLPDGWDLVKLGEVISEMKDGGTPPRKNPDNFGGDINWCVVKDIRPEIWQTKENLTEKGLQNCSAKVWDAGSVIISLGATIGNVGIAKIPVATKQGLSGIVVNSEKITPEYLYYVLRHNKDFILSLASGTTIKEVRPSRLQEKLTFPLPPLPEQRQQVKLLNHQLAAAAKAQQAADEELNAINALPGALLRQAFAIE
ncbi:MAG: restriction endonuclease subunit S [Gammaproteobacteria bacterium]